jgi:hypothetical protein
MKRALLSGIRMASLENAYSRLARINLTFARDKILKVQLKRGREVSMSYLVSALSEDAARSGSACSKGCISRDGEVGARAYLLACKLP